MKINPEKEQFRSAYAVPIIQATKFVAGLAPSNFVETVLWGLMILV